MDEVFGAAVALLATVDAVVDVVGVGLFAVRRPGDVALVVCVTDGAFWVTCVRAVELAVTLVAGCGEDVAVGSATARATSADAGLCRCIDVLVGCTSVAWVVGVTAVGWVAATCVLGATLGFVVLRRVNVGRVVC